MSVASSRKMGDTQRFLNIHTTARVDDYPDNSGTTDLVPFPECRPPKHKQKSSSVPLNQTLVRIMKNTLSSVETSDRKLDNLLANQLRLQNQQIAQERACLRRLRREHNFSRHMMEWMHQEQIAQGDLRRGKRKRLPPIKEVTKETNLHRNTSKLPVKNTRKTNDPMLENSSSVPNDKTNLTVNEENLSVPNHIDDETAMTELSTAVNNFIEDNKNDTDTKAADQKSSTITAVSKLKTDSNNGSLPVILESVEGQLPPSEDSHADAKEGTTQLGNDFLEIQHVQKFVRTNLMDQNRKSDAKTKRKRTNFFEKNNQQNNQKGFYAKYLAEKNMLEKKGK